MNQPDPLNLSGDHLYGVYRRGIITRHITENGRFLETIALESADDRIERDVRAGRAHVHIRHSVRLGSRGPHLVTKVPVENARYSEEIDTALATEDGKYQVRPSLWVPLIKPIKFPGADDTETVAVRRGPSPWWPQAPTRLAGRVPKAYYVATSSAADNPAYYGGMALAAFSLESLHGVSSHSITYARKLVEGLVAMEMNGNNGYLIRYDRWQTKSGEAKEIRGASNEELLGTMLGLIYYLRAEQHENPNHPLLSAARALRDRVLQKVSRGDYAWSYYEHPFMVQSYVVKNYEYAFYASTGLERGRAWFYKETLYKSMSSWIDSENRMQNLAMCLYSMVLVLEGDLPDSKKEEWARIFLYVIKEGIWSNSHKFRKNAFLAVVALLINKYLNPQRDAFFLSQQFRDIWTRRSGGYGEVPAFSIQQWKEVVGAADDRVAFAKSLENEQVAFKEEYRDHWQHNLPLCTVNEALPRPIWKPHNPHERIGAFFEWKSAFPQWWRRGAWKFGDYQGWAERTLPGLTEEEYLASSTRRFHSIPHAERELCLLRGHCDTQIEGAGMSLLFLRMLLTAIAPAVYSPPQLADRNVEYPVLPFRGVEPLDPKFLYCRAIYRSDWENWQIAGDKDKALRAISFPHWNLVISAVADSGERLWLDAWRLQAGHFAYLGGHQGNRFDQVVLRKASSTGGSVGQDLLVVALRAETSRAAAPDDQWLQLLLYRVEPTGAMHLLAARDATTVGAGAAAEIDMCILNHRYACVAYKTRNAKARVKVFQLDPIAGQISERSAFDAEYGTSEGHEEIGDFVWVGSAWGDVLINGYKTQPNPYSHFHLFSRRRTALAQAYFAHVSAVEDRPVAAVTLMKEGKYYLVTAGYDHVSISGQTFVRSLVLDSFEVRPTGELSHRGSFQRPHEPQGWDMFLLREIEHFDRMSMTRARFGRDEGFVIAGKATIGDGKGLVLLYGGITSDGRPTIWDWNCLGSGDADSVKMVDVVGDAHAEDSMGAVTVYKDKDDVLAMAYWRFGEDFQLKPVLQNFRRMSATGIAVPDCSLSDGND